MMQLELLRIFAETKKTVLFVTHQLDEAVLLADRVVALSARPGAIKEIVEIEIARPRGMETKRDEAFQAYVGRCGASSRRTCGVGFRRKRWSSTRTWPQRFREIETMRALKDRLLFRAIVFGCLLAAGKADADDAPVKIAIPSNTITGFCMGLRLARDPDFPTAAGRDTVSSQDILLPIPQFPTAVNDDDVNIGECSGISTIVNAWNKGAKNFVAIGSAPSCRSISWSAPPTSRPLPT